MMTTAFCFTYKQILVLVKNRLSTCHYLVLSYVDNRFDHLVGLALSLSLSALYTFLGNGR